VAKCNKEVVVCGGAINSPQLLMLSGIGPKDALRKLDIEVLVDSPGVGQNLQDHLLFPMSYDSKTPTYHKKDGTLLNLLRFLISKKGPLTTTGLECTSFFNTGVQPELKAPDMQIHFLAATLGNAETNNTNSNKKLLIEDKTHEYSFALLLVMLHPKSIGSLTLKSNDPFEHPVIEPNYLHHKDDVRAILSGIRKAQQIIKAKAFEPHVIGSRTERSLAGVPADLKADSDEWWSHYIKHASITCYHPIGTCKMGKDIKTGAVVDSELRVFGVRGLRVADCSIMPTQISGNTNAPAIVVGEKAADLIKKARL